MSFDDELRGAFARADASIERLPLDWTVTFARARRSRRIYLAAVAVGAAAVVGLGAVVAADLTTGGGGRGPGKGDVAGTPTTEPTETTVGNVRLIVPHENVEAGDCSAAKEANEMSPLEEQDGLPEQVQQMRTNIVYAAWNCDYDELAKLANALSFNFNDQAVPDYADYWRDLEAEGTRFTATVVRVLAVAHAEEDGGLFVWPSAQGRNATDSDFRALVEAGLYTQAEVDRMRQGFGGYTGARIGIRNDGDWQYYAEGGD